MEGDRDDGRTRRTWVGGIKMNVGVEKMREGGWKWINSERDCEGVKGITMEWEGRVKGG